MDTDPARQYLDVKAKLDSAFKAVTELASFIDEVANAMQQNRWEFTVPNMNIGFSLQSRGGYRLNVDRWPSAQQIGELFVELQRGRQLVMLAWRNLSADERSNLPRPASFQ